MIVPTTPAAPASYRSLSGDYTLFNQLLPGPPFLEKPPSCPLPDVDVLKVPCCPKPRGAAQATVSFPVYILVNKSLMKVFSVVRWV